jgi:hypothetical protein
VPKNFRYNRITTTPSSLSSSSSSSSSFPILYLLKPVTDIKQEVLRRTNPLVSLIRHGPHWKRRVQQLFYCFVCIRYRGNVSTESLPSNDRGIITEPLPSNNKGIFAEQLPSNDRGIQRHTHTHAHTQTATWTHKPTFSQNKESRLTTDSFHIFEGLSKLISPFIWHFKTILNPIFILVRLKAFCNAVYFQQHHEGDTK